MNMIPCGPNVTEDSTKHIVKEEEEEEEEVKILPPPTMSKGAG